MLKRYFIWLLFVVRQSFFFHLCLRNKSSLRTKNDETRGEDLCTLFSSTWKSLATVNIIIQLTYSNVSWKLLPVHASILDVCWRREKLDSVQNIVTWFRCYRICQAFAFNYEDYGFIKNVPGTVSYLFLFTGLLSHSVQ